MSNKTTIEASLSIIGFENEEKSSFVHTKGIYKAGDTVLTNCGCMIEIITKEDDYCKYTWGISNQNEGKLYHKEILGKLLMSPENLPEQFARRIKEGRHKNGDPVEVSTDLKSIYPAKSIPMVYVTSGILMVADKIPKKYANILQKHFYQFMSDPIDSDYPHEKMI